MSSFREDAMRAVVIESHGGLETLRVTDAPMPQPGRGEVRIRVRACALNHLDTWVRRGVPGHRFPLPLIPGSDVAGVVDAGDAQGLDIGDEVVAVPFVSCGRCHACLSGNEVACKTYGILGETRNGGCAEYVCVPATHVLPKPRELSFEEAASLLLAPLTAYHMLHSRARVAAGEGVLVTAAGGGVGTAAVQLAVRAGARVVALVGSDVKRSRVLELGADDVVVVEPGEDPLAIIRQALGRVSFDVVIDSVGASFFEAGVALLKPFGRLVTCGATSGAAPSLDLRRVFFRSLSILGSTMGNRWELAMVLQMAVAGEIRPVIHRVLPLEEIAEAHRLLESREVIGKVVVTP